MVNKPKQRGTAAETAVVRALRTLGFPHAERRALAGAQDLGDITGTPGIVWEVKGGDAARNASDLQIAEWMAETERERLHVDPNAFGVLVTQRRSVGAPNAHRWWAWLPFWQVAELGTVKPFYVRPAAVNIPLRMMLGDACILLRGAGYGQPLPAAEAVTVT